jgi:predicted permease
MPPRRGPFLYVVLGRLRAGVDRAAATEELRAINRRIFPLWRASYQDQKATWSLMDLDADIVGDRRPLAGLALVAVALVWLIACANASNLLIARVTSRRRELAIRTALGASCGRVVRYLLAESGLLAVGAAVIGGALAWAGVSLVRTFGFPYVPRADEIGADGRLLALFAVLTAASALLFGLVPAIHGSGGAIDETLRSGGRSSSASQSVRRLRRILVGSQFAIATPLVIVAALLLGSLNELGRVDLGFDSRNLLTGAISLPPTRYPEAGRVMGFWDELQRRVAALPGVSAVAFADGRPPDDVGNFNNFDLEDAPTPPGQSQPVAPWVSVTPPYFQLLGLGLSEGRILVDEDGRRPALEAVVVDRAWAARFFPKGSAVGKRFREGGCTECPWTTVVGVVSDVKYNGLNRPGEGAVYWPMDPASRDRYVLVRATLDPGAVVPAVRQVVRELDPGLPLSSVATIDDLVARSLRAPRALTLLVGGFASVALLLCIVGIYGVMAYYVEQHAKDISIRLALGGSTGEVVGLVVKQGMRVVAGGVVAGLVAAIALARLASELLFGIRALDPVTYVAATAGLLSLAALACILPASRAAAGDTAMVLRAE